MSLTNDQLLDRIVLLEGMLNDIQTALNNLATRRMVKNLSSVRQDEIDDLQARVTSLESQVALLT